MMDENLAEQVWDKLNSIGPEMTKGEILDQVEEVQDLIFDEMGWEEGID